MISMTNETTTWIDQRPSGFAMPTCGRAFGSTLVSTLVSVDLGTPATAFAREATVRGRMVSADQGVIKGHLGRAVAYVVPGTNAWSPPIC